MKNIIEVNKKRTKIYGNEEDILCAFSILCESLVKNNVAVKEDLHTMIDIAFMNRKELNEFIKKQMLDLFNGIKEKSGDK